MTPKAEEFGIARGEQRLAALAAFITDVHAVGLASVKSGCGGETFLASRLGKSCPNLKKLWLV